MAVSERLERTAELQKAVDHGEFVLYYQPIVSLDGGEAIAVEALVRWDHPERGLLLPEEFVSLAEETGLIIPIGGWVLEEACRTARGWQQRHNLVSGLRLSVNISARHFQHEGLIEDVSNALSVSGLEPACLVLEITESVLVQDAESVISRMLELKSLGVAFAVDDFGTGYSSLSYLRRFPIDILKVDKSFVDDVGDSDKAAALAKAIVQLGTSLNLDTVAEGIEKVASGRRVVGAGLPLRARFLLRPACPRAGDRTALAADGVRRARSGGEGYRRGGRGLTTASWERAWHAGGRGGDRGPTELNPTINPVVLEGVTVP